jgi:hypothetical protein
MSGTVCLTECFLEATVGPFHIVAVMQFFRRKEIRCIPDKPAILIEGPWEEPKRKSESKLPIYNRDSVIRI